MVIESLIGLKISYLEVGTPDSCAESMLGDVSGMGPRFPRWERGRNFRARWGGKSYNQGTPSWREQPPWEIWRVR